MAILNNKTLIDIFIFNINHKYFIDKLQKVAQYCVSLQTSKMGLFGRIKTIILVLKMFAWMSFVALIKSYYQVGNKSRLQQNWCGSVCQFFKLKMLNIESKYSVSKQKTLYLFNHRSQADFFIHSLILNAHTNFLARREVAILFGITSYFARHVVWWFKRSGVDIQKFNLWLDKKYDQSPQKGLIVYPQGHRMYGSTTVAKDKIKRGMLKYAYSRNIQVQIIMTFGNQQAFNQKQLKINYGQQIFYQIGKIIHPKDFQNQAEFIEKVTTQFIQAFEQTYRKCQAQVRVEDKTDELLDYLKLKTS